jgi:hypothetical protein
MKFKLLAGKHVQRDSAGVQRAYKPGDVIESEVDLAMRFNAPGSRKFEPVLEETPLKGGAPTPHPLPRAPQHPPGTVLSEQQAIAAMPPRQRERYDATENAPDYLRDDSEAEKGIRGPKQDEVRAQEAARRATLNEPPVDETELNAEEYQAGLDNQERTERGSNAGKVEEGDKPQKNDQEDANEQYVKGVLESLDQMTEAEMKEFAAEQEIDLKGIRGKHNVANAIRNHYEEEA